MAPTTRPQPIIDATSRIPNNQAGYKDGSAYDAFVDQVRRFHGYAAPGVLLGGAMVEAARQRLAPGALFDAVCESVKCLPDAIQLLTPCTVGNGWLRILDFGIFALTLYDKHTGHGWRVHLDVDKLGAFAAIRAWFLKETPKAAQDGARLAAEIRQAGRDVLTVTAVTVRAEVLHRKRGGAIVRCPLCGAVYPTGFGAICRACQGESPYGASPQTVLG